MEFLLDANVAYVLLVMGMMFVLMGLLTPGTGWFEAAALFSLVLAGYAVYHLGINLWALVPLALALVRSCMRFAFTAGARRCVIATIVLVMGGSVLLFPGEDGGWIGVNPLVAGLVSLVSSSILWLFAERAFAARRPRPR